jgi:hypothetical protein
MRSLYKRLKIMAPVVHPGRHLKPEMVARHLSANRLALDVGVPSGRITDILKRPTSDRRRHCRSAWPLFCRQC